MSISPQLRALGSFYRILAVYVDAAGLTSWDLDEVWNHPLVKTAQVIEERGEGWKGDHALQQMQQWGAKDQHGIYSAAGLTKRQTEVAFMFFDRQLEPSEIGKYLRLDAHTVRVHLQAAEERLRRLAA